MVVDLLSNFNNVAVRVQKKPAVLGKQRASFGYNICTTQATLVYQTTAATTKIVRLCE
jgi:hypothetical protein